jgi:prepilin peptidase CpaA
MLWNPQVAIAVFIGLTAMVEDVLRREIPNWIPVTALVGGLAASMWTSGWAGLGSSILGSLLGFVVFLVFYILGGMGGGDVKLMGGFGAVLGASRVLEAALWTAGLGGVMAAVAVGYSVLRKSKARPVDPNGKSSMHIPYAPAIALGSWLALVPRG